MTGRCHASHPHYQHDRQNWRCPLCHNRLTVDRVADEADPHCTRLHSDDIVACTNKRCEFTAYGNFVAKLMATRHLNIVCRPCKGQGHLGPDLCKRCSGRGYIPKSLHNVLKENPE